MSISDIYTYVKDIVPVDGITMISVCRNEIKRLPGWLEYYRSLGIRCFIVIDNDSSDGSVEYLRSQKDVHCLSMDLSFRESNFGMEWVNAARRALPADSWALYVDLDEYLVYRDCPRRTIDELVASLPDEANAVFALMVDMYPRGSFLAVQPDDRLVETCCFFDSIYRFRQRPLKPWSRARRELECLGGPRLRLISSLAREERSTWLDYFLRAQLGRLLKISPERWHRHIVESYPPQPPGLNKTPFTRCRTGEAANDYGSPHGIHHPVFADETAVLLHFKFTADLKDKINIEIHRKEHFRFGAEYIMYDKLIKNPKNLNLFSEEISQKFESPESFDRLGFFALTENMNF
ncbi:hypothetical protein LMIY3S_04505 [Labrys miyagiensis]